MTRTLASTFLAVLLLVGVSTAQTKSAAQSAQAPAVGAASKASAPAQAPAAAQKIAAPAAAATPAAAPGVVSSSPAAAEAKDASPQLQPNGYTYNPDGRRDPFISLLRRGADDRSNSGPRPPGLAGIGTSEVVLKGTMISRGGYVGILQGVDTKSYIVRVGDKLFDGSIRSISADAMVILQQVNDPLSLEKEREVRKQLRQTEEAK